MDQRENWKIVYTEYVESGGIVSPMNTESCRKYLENKLKTKVNSVDVLWLYYHTK